jgi:hypothetical protein
VGLFGGDISFFNHDMFMIWLIFHLLDSINVIKGFLEDKSKRSLEIVFFFFSKFTNLWFIIHYLFSQCQNGIFDLRCWGSLCIKNLILFFYIYITRGFVFYFLWDKKNEWRTIYTRGHFNYSLFLCLKLYLSMFQKYI